MGMQNVTVLESPGYSRWLAKLRDRTAVVRITMRVRRLQVGLLGDVREIGDGVFELRIDYGPGYRVYATRIERSVILLLCGGDKRTQSVDIALAKRLARRERVRRSKLCD